MARGYIARKAPRKAPAKTTSKAPSKAPPRKAPVRRATGIRLPRIRRHRTTGRALPGQHALREIISQQKRIELIIPKRSFQRLVREIAIELKGGIQFQAGAIEALQEAAEAIVINELAMANMAAIHAKRVTVQQKDMEFIRNIRRMMTGFRFPGEK